MQTSCLVLIYQGALNPTEEEKEDIINTVVVLCKEWLTGPREDYKEAVAQKLHRLVSSPPWLLDSLPILIKKFVATTIYFHSPA